MKKVGFTLAEVLITLTIIGVVAALTTPALYHNVATADIGPRLAKFRSTIEEANKRILIENDVNRLSLLLRVHQNDPDFYTTQLQNFMRIDEFNRPQDNAYTVYDYAGNESGQVTVSVSHAGGNNTLNVAFNQNSFNFRTVEGMGVHFALNNNLNDSVGAVFIDINGDTAPNRFGRDIFGFVIDNNGMLIPIGSPSIAADESHNWNNSCTANRVSNGLTCTASIFANNRSVVYQD